FQGIGRISSRADGNKPEFSSRLHDLFTNTFIMLIRSPQFKPRSSCHTVAQTSHRHVTDLDTAHMEELHLLNWSAIELFDNLPSAWALDLQTPIFPVYRSTHRPRRRTAIFDTFDHVIAILALYHQPTGNWSTANIGKLYFCLIKETIIAHHVTLRRHRHILFGSVDRKVFQRVDRVIR